MSKVPKDRSDDEDRGGRDDGPRNPRHVVVTAQLTATATVLTAIGTILAIVLRQIR